MVVRIIGQKELHRALVGITQRVSNLEPVTKQLETDMRKYAHVITGYMRSTVYHTKNVAGADAYYAGFEADRGDDHDFAQRAIDAFPEEKYFDFIVEPF